MTWIGHPGQSSPNRPSTRRFESPGKAHPFPGLRSDLSRHTSALRLWCRVCQLSVQQAFSYTSVTFWRSWCIEKVAAPVNILACIVKTVLIQQSKIAIVIKLDKSERGFHEKH
jgi:hypothetical protein